VLQRLFLALTVFAFAGPAAAHAQEVELAWKFEANKEFFQTMKTETTQTMTINNQEVKQNQEQQFVFRWKVVSKADDKIVLEQVIESVFMKIRIGTNEIVYNSKQAESGDNPLASFFKPLVGAKFTITLDPKTMKIVGPVGGRQEFLNSLKQANPAMSSLLNTILSEDQFKQLAEPAFAVLPEPGKKIKPKDTWERQAKLGMGPIGTYEVTYTYTYEGVKKEGNDEFHHIGVKTALKWNPPTPEAATGLPFRIEGGSLLPKSAEGTILFDAKTGRVHSSNMTVELSGKLNVAVGETKAEVNLVQKQVTTTTTSDKDPSKP